MVALSTAVQVSSPGNMNTWRGNAGGEQPLAKALAVVHSPNLADRGQTVILNANDSFEVTWDDPADAALTWAFDQMHAPRPLPPLSMHLFASFYREVLGAPVVVANGYGFFHNLTVPPPPEDVMRRGVVDVWENDYLP